MILYEFEGKRLLKAGGIDIPEGKLIESPDGFATSRMTIKTPCVLKAQVLSGKRAGAGGIIKVSSEQGAVNSLKELFSKEINKEKVDKVLIEEMVEYEGPEYYVSISYDTDSRGPILTISSSGGTGIEEREVQMFPIDPTTKTVIPAKAGIQNSDLWIPDQVRDDIIRLFFEQDMLLLEVNPLVRVQGTGDSEQSEKWYALDAKIKLDDDAKSRHEDWTFPPRLPAGRVPTENEIAAKKIDEGDYRGTAGSAYFDLEGDIAILSSGGGVSLTAMDALISAGGKPANFTEYSGNPPKEKVVKLTKIVLNKPNIRGLWVVGTVAANFTDIFETLSGLIDGLKELKEEGIKMDFPIVIRRGGPRDKEAFEMLREVKDFNLVLQGEETSISESAKIMAKLAEEYSKRSHL